MSDLLQTADEIIKAYSLEPHPPDHVVKRDTERVGQGEFAVYQTDLDSKGSTQKEVKWSPHSAVFHLNRSATMHLHHAGRAKYTLIEAYPAPGQAPRIKEIIVGANAEQGEVRQLLVEGGDQGWWKRSEVPLPEEGHLDQLDKTGCLISEVVIPGTFPGQREADL
ncbi:hypothetical protein OC861_000159 [Tilletia horrida]|nr:hypothetical protein OC861_000159 [Tilletia horrida]